MDPDTCWDYWLYPDPDHCLLLPVCICAQVRTDSKGWLYGLNKLKQLSLAYNKVSNKLIYWRDKFGLLGGCATVFMKPELIDCLGSIMNFREEKINIKY